MPNNRNIKNIAWARVTNHFKAAFLVSLVPMILTVLSVMSNHNRTTNFTDDRMLDNSDYTNVPHEINHFLQDNWPTILADLLIGMKPMSHQNTQLKLAFNYSQV